MFNDEELPPKGKKRRRSGCGRRGGDRRTTAPSACGDIPDELDVAVDDNNRMRASAAGLPPA